MFPLSYLPLLHSSSKQCMEQVPMTFELLVNELFLLTNMAEIKEDSILLPSLTSSPTASVGYRALALASLPLKTSLGAWTGSGGGGWVATAAWRFPREKQASNS